MDVQKYIKRLKFARADMSRATGYFETRDEALDFLNSREFFFGDPFVVKYKDRDDNNEVKLLLAIGKSENPEVNADTTAVTGATGPDAYELIDVNDLKDEIENLWEALNEEISARTEADEHLQEQIDEINEALETINELIEELSGATETLKEIVGEGWLDYPDKVTITDRIKKDEQLAGIFWGHNDGEPYDGHLPDTGLTYASGESIADMIETISDTLSGVLFEDEGVTKSIKFEYNPERNILYYTAGTQTGAIELSQAAIVDRAYYDSDTEELVIEFILGEGKEQEVRIPVKNLITEWDVADTDTVKLHKERVLGGGPDILTADVKISSGRTDNMLVIDGANGLYVSSERIEDLEKVLGTGFTPANSVTEVVNNIKGGLATAEDGHFPTDYFSGSTVNGSTNIQEAILKLDEKLVADEAKHDEDIAAVNSAITELNDSLDELEEKVDCGFTKNKVEVFVDDNASHVTLDSQFAEDGHVIYTIGETNIASEDEVNANLASLSARTDEINTALENEVAARESVKLVKIEGEELAELGPDVREAYKLVNPDGEESVPVKIYKDSVIYKIYFGHVDDQLTSPTDPTVIPGTGETAICFIYFDAEGNYALTTTEFKITDELWAALDDETTAREDADQELKNEIDALAETVQEEQDVVAIALNRLAEAVISAKTSIELEMGTKHITLEKTTGPNGEDLYILGERDIASAEEMISGFDGIANDMGSFVLGYDSDEQDLVLTWSTDGNEHSTKVDVSDFVKDSFLENVQVVIRDGVKYLEFRFKTYDGEPVPIYIPLTDLAIIYTAGQGIDRQEMEDNQVITVKIDTFARKNYLAKSDNGLLVTGITEEIQEALAGVEDMIDQKISAATEDFDERYVRKDEVEDHFDTASTLPVQNKVITEALNDIEEQMSQFTADALTGVTMVGDGNIVVSISRNGSDVEAVMGNLTIDEWLDSGSTNPVMNSAITQVIMEDEEVVAAALNDLNDRKADRSELEDLEERIENEIEGNIESLQDELDRVEESVGLDEDGKYIPKSGTTYLDDAESVEEEIDALDKGLAEEVSARTEAINDLRDELLSLSAFTADTIYANEAYFESLTAGTIVNNEIQGNVANFSGLTANTIYADEYQNLPTATTEQFGVVILDDELDSGSTNPVMNSAITKVILENEETIAAAFNDLNDRKADKSDLDGAIADISSALGNYLTGVTTSGSGNIVTGVTKTGQDVVAELGNVDLSGTLKDVTVETAATATQFVAGIEKDGDNVNAILVDIDDALSTASTNPVQNKVVTQIIIENERVSSAAFNDLNRRKANVEDIPLTLSDLQGYSDMATKNDLGDFLPLSGGTMTGNISGETGVAVYMPGGFYQQSDERTKIFIGDIENALEKVNEIPTRYFYWLNMPDGPRHIGTSAQKVQEVFPEIVSGDSTLSVDYSKLSVIALAAIKELTAKVEDLQRQLDELKK